MNNQIRYLINEFIKKHNDEPNLILIPKDMYKFDGSYIRWKYSQFDYLAMDYVREIDLNVIRCDYINEIQILKVIR